MQTFKKFGPFWPFLFLVNIRPQILPAALLFIRPILSNAAEQSASWQLWFCIVSRVTDIVHSLTDFQPLPSPPNSDTLEQGVAKREVVYLG
jgi:hypothetical protein